MDKMRLTGFRVRAFFRGMDEVFEDVVEAAKPVVGQIEEFAARNGVELSKGWKVELVMRVKARLLKVGLDDPSVKRLNPVFAAIIKA
jgi:hypothetical protein